MLVGSCRMIYKDRPIKRQLLPGSVPTLFPHKDKPKERTSSTKHAEKRQKQQVPYNSSIASKNNSWKKPDLRHSNESQILISFIC